MEKEEGDSDLCRCCHNEGSYKSLYETYSWMDEEIIYFNMLQECFDVELSPVSINLQNMLSAICEECVEQLHAAVKFKRQVQKCEWRFKEVYGSFVQPTDAEVKIEESKQEDTKEQQVVEMAISNVQSVAIVGNDHSVDDDHDMDVDHGMDNDHNKDDSDEEIIPSQTTSSVMARQFDKLMSDAEHDITDLLEDDLLKERSKKKTTKNPTNAKVSKTTENKGATKRPEEAPEEAVEKVVNERIHIEIREGVHIAHKEGLYQCLLCEDVSAYKQKTRNQVIRHIKSYHIQTYKCSVCSEQFCRWTHFLNHKLQKHNIDERVQCNACDARFNIKRQLVIHMKTFHKLGKLYTCNECDFETHRKYSIKKHQLVHIKDRNYKCEFCPKSFKRASTLNMHKRIHTGEKRKKCTECGTAFVQRASLKYHMHKHHPGAPF